MSAVRGAILLVDDEEKILKRLGRALRDEGHEVTEASNARDCSAGSMPSGATSRNTTSTRLSNRRSASAPSSISPASTRAAIATSSRGSSPTPLTNCSV